MRLKPDEISPEEYRLIKTLDHEDVIPFVQEHIMRKNHVTRLYVFFNILFLINIIAIIIALKTQGYPVLDSILQVGLGFILAVLLVPLHELCHALVFYLEGARRVRFKAYWKKFYFTAQAPGFVVNWKQFRLVAIAPFLIITLLFFICMYLLPGYIAFFAGTIFAHTIFSGGDFGLLSFFYQHRHEGIISYDNFDKKESYFFIEIKKNQEDLEKTGIV